MRETKTPLTVPEIPHAEQHATGVTPLKTLVASRTQADTIHAVVAKPVWKAAVSFQNAKRVKAVVKGPIRCHKCQLMCIDAEHYLSHKCELRCEIKELRNR
jgi:hypothetical protein